METQGLKTSTIEDILKEALEAEARSNPNRRVTVEFWNWHKGNRVMQYHLTRQERDSEGDEYTQNLSFVKEVECDGGLREHLELIVKEVESGYYRVVNFYDLSSSVTFRLEDVTDDIDDNVLNIKYKSIYGRGWKSFVNRKDFVFDTMEKFIKGDEADSDKMRCERLKILEDLFFKYSGERVSWYHKMEERYGNG